jgi:hypothetical protein
MNFKNLSFQQLPQAEREKAKQTQAGDAKHTPVNDRAELGLLEFEVNVTSRYNGYFVSY